MDEPLGALDRRLRDQMQQELKRIQGELGITVIYVTHDQSEAMAMANRIGIMAGGRLLQVADPETIYAAPSNHFVARFLGECSILRVTATDGGRGYEIAGVRQSLPSPATAPFDIVVRPENVSVRSAPQIVSDSAFGVPATIRDVTYLGAGWRVALELSDGQSLLASITRGDDGSRKINFAQILGGFSAAALSNAYFPEKERGVNLVLINGFGDLGANVVDNLIREFVLNRLTSRAQN